MPRQQGYFYFIEIQVFIYELAVFINLRYIRNHIILIGYYQNGV
jgi:hypothetical protein